MPWQSSLRGAPSHPLPAPHHRNTDRDHGSQGTHPAYSGTTDHREPTLRRHDSYPNDWERQNVLTSGVRDYRQNTVNIANFFSPSEIAGDPLSYNSLSIDVDQNSQGDFDAYFNQATLAIGKTYYPQMKAHSFTLKIGGYNSYELDFETKDVKGAYIFIKTEDAIYIFAFKGTTKPIVVQALSDEIVSIYQSIKLNPPGAAVVKQR